MRWAFDANCPNHVTVSNVLSNLWNTPSLTFTGLPPGPPPLPLLGNMLSFNWNLDKVRTKPIFTFLNPTKIHSIWMIVNTNFQSYFEMSNHQVLLDWKTRYGRVFTVWLPYPMVVIGDHEVSYTYFHIEKNWLPHPMTNICYHKLISLHKLKKMFSLQLLQEHVVKNGDVYLGEYFIFKDQRSNWCNQEIKDQRSTFQPSETRSSWCSWCPAACTGWCSRTMTWSR